MQPPRVKLTIRGMRVAIAIMALGLAALAGRRRALYQERAAFHAAAEQRWLRRASDVETTGSTRDASPPCEWVDTPANRHRSSQHYRKNAAYHAWFRTLYERAADRPWELVEPDT
jgi:hypothetical protein